MTTPARPPRPDPVLTELREMRRAMERMAEEVTRLGERLDRRLDGIDGRLTGIDGRLEGLDRRVDTMVDSVADVSRELAGWADHYWSHVEHPPRPA